MTTLNNSVKPKRIRSISSVKKTYNPQRCACYYILQRVAASEKGLAEIFLLEGFRKFNRSFGLESLREQLFSKKERSEKN